jgi:hypothetical protein
MHNIYCPFDRVLFTTEAKCALARRYAVAERVGIACSTWQASHRCARLLNLLRHKMRFALGLRGDEDEIPYGKEMKLRTGGLLGLQAVVDPERAEARQVEDIHLLVQQAIDEFGSLDAIPFQPIARSVAAYRTRRRSNRPH